MDAIIEFDYVIRERDESLDDWRENVATADGLVRSQRLDAEIYRIDAYYNRSLYPDPRVDAGSTYTGSIDALMILRALQGGWTSGDRMHHTISLWVAMREDILDWAWERLNEDARPNNFTERSLSVGDVLVVTGEMTTLYFKVVDVGFETINPNEFADNLTMIV